MTGYSEATIWAIIVALGVGTYLIRLSFIGLFGDRPFPPWLIRALRYTPVAVMPGLVAPLVIWPQATGGAFDLPRAGAAAATLLVGLVTRNTLAAIAGGAVVLYGGLWLAGGA